MNKLYKISKDIRKNNKKVGLLRLFVTIMALLIVGRLLYLQIFDVENLKKRGSISRQNRALNQAMRGDIVDRNGAILVSSRCFYDIYIDPRNIAKDKNQLSYEIATALNMPKAFVEKKITNEKKTVILAKNVDVTTYKKLKALKLKCLDIRQKAGRDYPQGKLAAHILGYVNPEANIYAGIESTAQHALEEMPEAKAIETNGKGDVIYDLKTDPDRALNPIKGKKITLTIDTVIQHIAEVELRKTVAQYNAQRGCVIVLNPKNGEILAFAIAPTYEPFNYKKYDQKIVKNWALTDVYQPGSTFKVITVASALENGVITPNTKVMDTGQEKIQGYTIKNYDYRQHPSPGVIGLPYLFEHSSNIGSLRIGMKMSDEQFYTMLRKFGFGQKTGIDLPGESSGLLPKTPWQTIRQATISFGYSIAATPIQMASAVGAIANNGVWITPHIIKYSEEELPNHVSSKQIMSAEHAKALTKILEQSIRNSKSNAGKIPNFTVAGKTGTSNKKQDRNALNANDMYTSFVGYFPSTNPEILIMVMIDSPKGGAIWGSTVAGPIFNSIASQMTRILNMTPDAIGLNVK